MSPTRDSQLRELSKHLLYEIRMLGQTMQVLAVIAYARHKREPSEIEQVVDSALLESWALHARNLIDFLYPPPSRKKDDSFAEHFFEDGRWNEIRPPMADELREIRRRVGKEVAHVTYKRTRVAPELKAWELASMVAALKPVLDMFAEHIPCELVVDGFKKHAAAETRPARRRLATGKDHAEPRPGGDWYRLAPRGARGMIGA